MSSMDVTNLTKNFMRKMFSEGKRFDGRGLLDLKDFTVEYDVSNKAEGSARVKMGKTEVIAGVKLAVETPYPDSQDRGNLIVSGDLLPLASPRFEMGPPGFDGIELPRLLDRMIRESKMIDLKKLAITPGEKVWGVYVDVYPINDDGSLLDAASIACVAALHNAFMPGITKDGRADYENRTKNKVPLNDILPVSFTFYKQGSNLILHPTREEQEACEAKVTFGISMFNGKHMINSCQKGWETPFSSAELKEMMKVLPGKYDETLKKLKKYLK